MYSQECYHYKRPDVSHVTFITPQQMDAIRLEGYVRNRVDREPVRVWQTPPQVRPTPDENAEAQNLLQAAPRIVAACLQSGAAQIPEPVTEPVVKVRRPYSVERRRKQSAAMKRAWKNRRTGLFARHTNP